MDAWTPHGRLEPPCTADRCLDGLRSRPTGGLPRQPPAVPVPVVARVRSARLSARFLRRLRRRAGTAAPPCRRVTVAARYAALVRRPRLHLRRLPTPTITAVR